MAGSLASIVLPCRNQGEFLRDITNRYLQALESEAVGPFEVVLVPNASSDRTTDVAWAIAHDDARVRVVDNPLGGWGRSVQMGLEAAAGDLLCFTNSARTIPSQLPAIFRLHAQHAPCVAKVSRVRRRAPLREIGSYLYNLEARCLFGLSTHDVNGTPKVFSRELYRRLRLSSDGDLLDLELVVKATRLNVPIFELAVEGFPRHGGKSSTTLRSAWTMYAGAARMWSRLTSFPAD